MKRRNPASAGRVAAQWLARRAGHVLLSEDELEVVTERKEREVALLPKEEDERRVKLLAHRGVNLVLDVGANVGQYAVMTRRAGYSGRIVSFEPMQEAFSELSSTAQSDPAWDCRPHALGRSDGQAEMNVSRNSFSSSMLEIGERHLESAPDSEYVGTETIAVSRLDAIWDELVKPGERSFLKIDVQGFEMEVLGGAKDSLPKLAGVQTELSLVALYEGAPGFREVIDHLEESGFRLAGIEPEFSDPDTGELLQVNGLFVRD